MAIERQDTASIDGARSVGPTLVDFSGLERSIDDACALIDQFRAERAVMVQLLREAVTLFEDPEAVIDIRDWCVSAKAAIAKAGPRS